MYFFFLYCATFLTCFTPSNFPQRSKTAPPWLVLAVSVIQLLWPMMVLHPLFLAVRRNRQVQFNFQVLWKLWRAWFRLWGIFLTSYYKIKPQFFVKQASLRMEKVRRAEFDVKRGESSVCVFLLCRYQTTCCRIVVMLRGSSVQSCFLIILRLCASQLCEEFIKLIKLTPLRWLFQSGWAFDAIS